ncbi:hypothetical protein OROHE_003810 [Orobanche hederae]
MRAWEITPTIDDFLAREHVLETLKQIVSAWVIQVAQTKNDLPKDFSPSAGLFCHGSYGLQTYLPSSNLDVVVIGPEFASRELCHHSSFNVRQKYH